MNRYASGRKILFFVCFLGIAAPAHSEESEAPGWSETPSAVHPYFAEGKAISGTVQLGSGLIDRGYVKRDFSFSSTDVLFIIARKGAAEDSPPVAVVRIPNLTDKKFPLKFQIGPDDIMMAGDSEFVGPFNIKAKLSRHGGATTEPGDLFGYSKNHLIKMGSQDIGIDLTEIAAADEESQSKATIAGHSLSASSVLPSTAPHGSTPSRSGEAAAVSGEVALSPDLAEKLNKAKFSFAEGDALFVVAKDASSKENKPLAVARIVGLSHKKFPIAFTLSEADVMGSGAFKGPLLLKAKLSRQGSVETQKGDLSGEYAEAKGVKLGEKGVKVVLTRLAE